MSAETATTAESAGGVNTEYAVRFLGSGSEYFRIWIVNLMLTIVTLGIYSAWAKVRRLEYMYRNTQIAGSSFDYHGSPLAILKGRAIALVLLVAYNFSFKLSVTAGFITLAVLAAAAPWLVRQSLRFRARYSSYRGIRFRFTGGLLEIYLVAAPLVVVIVAFALAGLMVEAKGAVEAQAAPTGFFMIFGLLTAAYFLLLPYLHYRFKRYQHGHAHLGSAAWRFTGRARSFYAAYALMVGLIIGTGVVVGLLGMLAAFAISGSGKGAAAFSAFVFTLAMLVGYLVAFAAFQAFIQNRIWNNTSVGEVTFRSAARMWPMTRIYLVNVVLIILTLGLFTPFAVIRTLKYRLESVTAVTAAGMDQFVASASMEQVAATGEGAADLFDFDIGL